MNFLGNYNILTELFLCNLEKQDKGFGDYFEGIVLEYLYHSKELLPFIRKMLLTKPEEIYLSLIEATAYGTRMIIEGFEEAGLEVKDITLSGGIPIKNEMLVQVYSDVCNRKN